MAKLDFQKTVNAPIEETFRLFSDFPNAAQRVSGIESVEVMTDGPVGVGTRFRETRIMFGKEATEEMEVTRFEPNQLYTVEADSCGAHFVSTFRFEPKGEQTLVTMNFDSTPVSLFAKLMSPLMMLMSGSVRKAVESDMNDLAEFAQKNCRNQIGSAASEVVLDES